MPIIKRRCSGVESRLRARMGDRAHGKPYASHAVRVILWGREEGRTGKGRQSGRGLRTAALHERSRGASNCFLVALVQRRCRRRRRRRRCFPTTSDGPMQRSEVTRGIFPLPEEGVATFRSGPPHPTDPLHHHHHPLPPQADLSLRSPEMRRRGSKVGGGGGLWCRRGRQAPRAIHLHKRQDQRSTQE